MAKKFWILGLLVLILGSPGAILAVSPLDHGADHEVGETDREREATSQETADREVVDHGAEAANHEETGEREVPDHEITDAERDFAEQVDAAVADHEGRGDLGARPADHVDVRVTESEDGSRTVHLDYTHDDAPPSNHL